MEQQQFIETRVSHTRYLHPIMFDANAYLHSQNYNTNYSERERVTYNLVKQIFVEWPGALRCIFFKDWLGRYTYTYMTELTGHTRHLEGLTLHRIQINTLRG